MENEMICKKILSKQVTMALATSENENPNVRIVNFYYDEGRNKIFFTTFKGNQKLTDIEVNQQVAFTTIPQDGTAQHVRSIDAQAKQSDLSVADVQAGFIAKDPSFQETIKMAGPMLVLCEITSQAFSVTLDFNSKAIVKL